MVVNQYQIVLVNLDPTMGSEIKKTRPCVVISPNEMNKYLRTVVVAPMTTSIKDYPTRVPVKHDGKLGSIALDQIRTIDKQRIVKAFQTQSKDEVLTIKGVLKETLKSTESLGRLVLRRLASSGPLVSGMTTSVSSKSTPVPRSQTEIASLALPAWMTS